MFNIRRTTDEIKTIVEKLGYVFLSEHYEKSGAKVNIKDVDGYKYDCYLDNLITMHPPHFVFKNNPYSLENISLWLKLNNKNFELSENNKYENSEKKLNFICLKCKEEFDMAWLKVYSNQNCPFCRGLRIGTSNNLAHLRPGLIEEWSIKNNVFPTEVSEFSGINVLWICKKCGYEWCAKIQTRTGNKEGCPACCGKVVTDKNRFSILFPEIAKEWHSYKNGDLTPDMFSYASSKKIIWWKCLQCGNEWMTRISDRTSGSGCPECSSSKGNKKIKSILTKSNIDFMPEHKFDDCKNIYRLPFDFYLPKNNTAIEYDGEFHYNESIFRFKNKEKTQLRLRDVQKRDAIKTQYCKNNNINLIRIPYWDFNNIESILFEKLNILLT